MFIEQRLWASVRGPVPEAECLPVYLSTRLPVGLSFVFGCRLLARSLRLSDQAPLSV